MLYFYIDTSWTLYAITAVAILYNITAVSWHGVLLAETARLAPPDQVGPVTGGVHATKGAARPLVTAGTAGTGFTRAT